MPGWKTPKARKKEAQVRFTEKLGQRICDLASENPSPTAISRMIGCGIKTVYWWIWCSSEEQKAAEAGRLERDPRFLIRWPTQDADAEPRFFHELFKLSQKMAGLTLDLENRSEAMFGTKRAVRDPKTNRQLFELDEAAIRTVGAGDPFSDEAKRVAADLYDYTDFPYLHDAAGKRIPVVERVPVPAQLKVHTLRSIVPQVYDITDKTEHSGTVQSHVLVIGGNKSIDRTAVSPLRNDLERRLAAMRERGPEHPRPENPLALMNQRGAGSGDPPEKLTREGSPPADVPPDVPPRPLAEHPRAYHVPRPSYARPDEHGHPADPLDQGGYGRGVVPSGGMKVV